jgi:hemerythrin
LETDPKGSLSEYRFVQLVNQTTEHFRTEEGFLETMGYPDFATHRLDHDRILERFRGEMVRWHTPSAPPLVDLVEEFAESTQRHLKIVDGAFVEWFEDQPGKSFPGAD